MHRRRPSGPMARTPASIRSSALPVGSTVRLDEKTSDRYRRLVAEVFSGININLAMVQDSIIRPWDYRRQRRRSKR